MAAIEIAEEMNTYFSQPTEAEQKSVVQMLKTFVDNKTPEQDVVDLEQYNKDIDESLSQFDSGEFYTNEEVTKIMKTP